VIVRLVFGKGKGKRQVLVIALLTRDRLSTRLSALQSRKWQLTGMS